MNKTDMVTKLAEKNGMTKKDAQKALNSLIEIISDEIKDGGRVALTGFGTFSIAERKPRTGRNPQTGQPIDIPAARVPKFKAGKVLKESVS
jgi:DNA-binding protein HU-beta